MKRRRARVLVRLFVTLFLLGIVLAVGFFVFHTNGALTCGKLGTVTYLFLDTMLGYVISGKSRAGLAEYK